MTTHYCSKGLSKEALAAAQDPLQGVPPPIYKANQDLEAMKKRLGEQEHTLGVDHKDTLTAVNMIGLFLREQGKLKEAEAYWRRALEGRERSRGPDHPNTLQSVSNAATSGQARPRRALSSSWSRRE